ncbi:laccase [Marasmius fiardii PR-910]|nr:laccase [Marasmius fiardii PR-910]
MLNVLLPLTLISCVSAVTIGPVADLVLVNGAVSPDGFNRSAVLPGGTHPGPVIVGQRGDTFRINVIDNLTDTSMLRSTSIHWHGFNQHGTNWADGPTMVTQCPITPGSSFEYQFQAADQAGTFWYHSHFSTQYCDGLRGAMVVYDPQDPHASLYDVDDESTVITLSDCFYLYVDDPAAQYGLVALPDATLINGLGRYPNGPASPLAVITVDRGRRYRFRLVSLSCDPNYTFSIDGHNMTIIEVDSHNTVPVVVNSLVIEAGQRYSFVLEANSNNATAAGNFWIRALPNFSSSTSFDQNTNLAILRYSGSAEADPTTTAPTDIRLRETDLHPLEDPSAPGNPTVDGADVNLNLVITFENGQFLINGAQYQPPTVPVLLQIMSGNVSAASLLPSGSIYSLPANSTIQVSFPLGTGGSTGAPHPIHLHGHPFSVIRPAGVTDYNFVDPVRRDVVASGTQTTDNLTIRFFTGTGNRGGGSSAGPWFLHCHIDRHMEAGLAVVFAEDSENAAATNPVPAAWDGLCPAYRNEFGNSGEAAVVPT